MADFAVLGFKAETDDMVKAVRRIKDVSEGAKKAQVATDDLAKATKRASATAGTLSNAYDGLSKSGKRLVDVSIDAQKRLLELERSSAQAGQAIDKLNAAFGRSTRQATDFEQAMALARRGLAALGVSIGLSQITKMADTWSDLSSRVGLAIKDMDGAAEVMSRLEKMARRTYSPLEMTAESFVANSTALRELGLNTKQQLDYTEALNNAFVVSGAKGERAASVSNALSKAMASGALRGDELNTVIQTGGRVAELLAEKMGTTVSGLRAVGKEGKITADVIYMSLIDAMQTLRDEADSMPATVGDAMVLMRNSFLVMVGTFDQMVGASQKVSEALIYIADHMQQVIVVGGTLLTMMATRYVVMMGTTAVSATMQLFGALVTVTSAATGMGMASSAAAVGVRTLTGALQFLRGVLMGMGIGLLAVAVGVAIDNFYSLAKAVGGFGQAFEIVMDAAGNFWDAFTYGLHSTAASLRAWEAESVAAILNFVATSIENVVWFGNRFVGVFSGAMDAIKAIWPQLPAAVGDAVTSAANVTIQGVVSMINVVIEKLNSFISSIRSSIGKAIYDSLPDISPEFKAANPWIAHLTADNPMEKLDPIKKLEVSTISNPYQGAAAGAGKTAAAAFNEAFNQDVFSGQGLTDELHKDAQSYTNVSESYAKAAESYKAVGQSHLATGKAIAQGAAAIIQSTKDGTDATDEAAATAAKLNKVLGDTAAAEKGRGGAAKKAGGDSKKASEQAKKAAEDHLKAMQKLREEMTGRLIQAIEGVSNAFADWVVRGFNDFKSFTSSIVDMFRNMLKEMIAMAVKNRIMLSVGIDPLSSAMSVAGAPVAGGTGVGGMLSGFLGKAIGSWGGGAAGGLLGGLSGVASGIGAGWASGGIGGALSGGLSASVSGITSGLAAGGIGGITAAIGAAVPIIAGVAAVFSIGKKLFGRKLKDTGIEATFSMAEGLAASTYKFYKGGLFRSNKTRRSALSSEMASPLERSMKQIGQSVLDMADTLGFAGASLENLSHHFKFSTKGLSEEEIQQRLQEEFEKFGNAAVQAAIPQITAYLRMGEGAYEGLQRLSSALATANDAMNKLSLKMFSVSLAGADLASSLADAFGGIENMAAATNNYFSKFYTESEQRKWLEKSTADALAKVNMVMPRTRDQYRSMVNALDLTTDSGRKAFAQLMGVADALDVLLPKLSSFSQSILEAANEVMGQIDIQIDYAKEMSTQMKAAAKEWYSAAKSIRDQIRSLFQSDLSGASESDKVNAARSAYLKAAEGVRQGDVESAKTVAGLAEKYLENLRLQSSSALEYSKIEARIRSELQLLAGIADLNGASKDLQAELYDRMVTTLEDLKTFLLTQGLTEEAIGKLDENLQSMYRDFDGTVTKFQDEIKSLSKAIEEAEGLTYETLLKQLNLNVDVIARADIPAEVKQLLIGANDGIRSSIDFIVRSDLAPDMKWLALRSHSEHAKTVDFLAGSKLPVDLQKLAISDVSKLQKNIHYVVAQDLPEDLKRIALANNSELSRKINVVLNRNDPDAIRIGLMNVETATKLIKTQVDLGGLTKKQQDVLDMVTGSENGLVTMAGNFQFDPSGAFKVWYENTTKVTMQNPMSGLMHSLNQLRAAVQADIEQRAQDTARMKSEAERKKMADAQANLASIASSRQSSIGVVSQSTGHIEDVARKHGVSLIDASMGSAGFFKLNSALEVEMNKGNLAGSGDSVDKFMREIALYRSFGSYGEIYNAGGKANTEIKRLRTFNNQLEAARNQVRALGGVPAFASGGLHAGGLRIVGERGPELERTGPSRITSNSDLKELFDNRGTVNELRRLREEVSQLRKDNTEAQVQIAKHSKRQTEMLRKWDIDGHPPERAPEVMP